MYMKRLKLKQQVRWLIFTANLEIMNVTDQSHENKHFLELLQGIIKGGEKLSLQRKSLDMTYVGGEEN